MIQNTREFCGSSNRWLCCLAFAIFASLALFFGCGESPPPVGELQGSVSFNDEPVGDCRLTMFEISQKRWVGGKVDEQGQFKITDIPLGEYEVSVNQRTTNAPKEEPFDKRIPKMYRDGKKSGFKISIVEGPNEMTLNMTDQK